MSVAVRLEWLKWLHSPQRLLRPHMSAPELPQELAGHLAVLKDKCDAYAKARAATAIASGKAHLAARICG